QDGQVEVTQGIGPADAVVAIGAAFLNDGDAVRLAGPGEAASAPAGAAR
ncbi:efflux transporter periplasmic adaptor subunit, partial [Ralstonia pseudosolanacearum]